MLMKEDNFRIKLEIGPNGDQVSVIMNSKGRFTIV